MVGIDASPTLVAAARDLAPDMELHVANAAALTFDDASFDQVASFMCLHDVDDLGGAVREIARVLESGGVASLAVVHPLNSHGRFVIRAAAGLVVDALREPVTKGYPSWSRLPLFLHLLARKLAD